MSQDESHKIIVVDDEEDVTSLVAYHLSSKGHEVQALNDPNKVVSFARLFKPHLFILDVMMPDLSGIQLCRLLRNESQFKDIPVIFLTAKSETEDRIAGLELGAEDYIGKPFSPRELVLRVETILRRRKGEGEGIPVLRLGKLEIDQLRHVATLDGQRMDLTATEFRLLGILIERKGRVQSREQLLSTVWNYDANMETRTVDTHIRRVREKLGSHAGLIETVRGVGYRAVEG